MGRREGPSLVEILILLIIISVVLVPISTPILYNHIPPSGSFTNERTNKKDEGDFLAGNVFVFHISYEVFILTINIRTLYSFVNS